MTELANPNNINLGDNIAKNVKFNEITNMRNPNFNPEQLTQQMNNVIQQQFKQNSGPSNPQVNMAPQSKGILKENFKMPNSNPSPTPANTVGGTDVSSGSGDYYSIFGFQLSKTTLYILIGFIVVIVAYIIYSKWFSAPKEDKKKKKKNSEVSYQEQEKAVQEEEEEQ